MRRKTQADVTKREDAIISSAIAVEIVRGRLDESGARGLYDVESAKDLAALKFAGRTVECFGMILLSSNRSVIGFPITSEGNKTCCKVEPRAILKEILAWDGCEAVVFVHNHPGGKAGPSNADMELTLDCRKLLGIMGVALVDHIIVCGPYAYSMREEGDMSFGN